MSPLRSAITLALWSAAILSAATAPALSAAVPPASSTATAPAGPTFGDEGALPPRFAEAFDTVVEARRGDRFVVRELDGRVRIEGGEGNRVTVRGGRPDGPGVELVREGGSLVLREPRSRGRSRDHFLTVTLPRWMAVELRGVDLSVRVSGLRSDVLLRTVDGELEVRDVEGTVDLHSVDGEIRVSDVVGALSATSVDEGVWVRNVRGSVRVESTDGDLVLEDVDADRVSATTMDGDLSFRGPIRPDGSYRLVTHSGDVTVSVPPGTGARVAVSTFDGSFRAGFPVTVDRFRGGRETSFIMGGGGAELVLQAFDGDIRLAYTEGGR